MLSRYRSNGEDKEGISEKGEQGARCPSQSNGRATAGPNSKFTALENRVDHYVNRF